MDLDLLGDREHWLATTASEAWVQLQGGQMQGVQDQTPCRSNKGRRWVSEIALVRLRPAIEHKNVSEATSSTSSSRGEPVGALDSSRAARQRAQWAATNLGRNRCCIKC